jgi:phosphohistidine phosphatase
MLVYLARHGEAVSERDDPSRPLSRKGAEDIREMAGLLTRHLSLMPGYIYHSPKSRAIQTASILHGALPHALAAGESDGLLPMDDPGIWTQRLETMDLDTLLVGHLPHLTRLASLLLIRDSGREILDFTPGTVVCLEKTGEWRVRWMISPDTLKSG